MDAFNFCSLVAFSILLLKTIEAADDDYNVVHRDGSFEFGYNNPDSYHYADGNRNNVVKGEFGGRNPKTGAIDSTIYTAGPRGFRPRGRNVHRKYDLNQNGPRPIGNRDDPNYDPYEDPSYSFSFRTRTYNRDENANRVGDVAGRYSYLDDVGERHNVEFIAGKNTGFHVKTPFPDSNPRAYGPLYFNGRGKPLPRGRTSIQRGLDGSYRFVSAGPDQRRTEVSDGTGHVRGSYTYLDDKGVQHSVHYIAGPETGYRVLKNVKGPHLPTVFPFGRPGIIPPDFYDYVGKDNDLFDTAASGPINPVDNDLKPNKNKLPGFDSGVDVDKDDFNKFTNDLGSTTPSSIGSTSRPTRPFGRPNRPNRPSYDDDSGSDSDLDLFGDGGVSSTTGRPSSFDDGSYKPSTAPSRPIGPTSTTTSRPFGGTGGGAGYGDSSEDSGSRPSAGSGYDNDGTTGFDSTGSGGSRPGTSGPGASRPGGSRPGSSRPGGSRPGGSRPGGSRPSGSRPSNRPSYDDYGDSDSDFGLFGSESNSRPPYGGNRPSIQFGITGSGDDDSSRCPNCQGTLVTNLGDRTFQVPPGVSVRAHVQAIDLLPFNDRIPSPSEQLRADMSLKTEQLNEAQSRVDLKTASSTTNSNVTVTTTTVATTTKNTTRS